MTAGFLSFPKKRQHPESDLQRDVFAHLRMRGIKNCFSFHCPNGGWRSPIEAAIFKAIGVTPGVPDVLCVYGGRLYALELKVKGKHPSVSQHIAMEGLRLAGAQVAVATGIDEAVKQLESWGLLRGT
jgi:hypothetical protein